MRWGTHSAEAPTRCCSLHPYIHTPCLSVSMPWCIATLDRSTPRLSRNHHPRLRAEKPPGDQTRGSSTIQQVFLTHFNCKYITSSQQTNTSETGTGILSRLQVGSITVPWDSTNNMHHVIKCT